MPESCQALKPYVVAVAGTAGSGKSTLARALARDVRVPLLDLDTLTNPLLEHLEAPLGAHWQASAHTASVRAGRYAALRAAMAEVLDTAGAVVLAAPFTAELGGGSEWGALLDAAGSARLHVVRIVGDPELFAERRAARGATRDVHRPADRSPAPAAQIPVIEIDADLTTEQQLARLRRAVGLNRPVKRDAAVFAADFDAVLFDLDGTLADSTASVNRSWRRFAAEFGVSAAALRRNHGQPARQLVAKLLGAERTELGLLRITELEVADAVGVQAVPGAQDFLASVPESQRAIVTSGSVPIAAARLAAAGLTPPAVMVTVEDVTFGKPDPEPYLLAARRLGVDPRRCLVVEDAQAGIEAAQRAGCTVLALSGTEPFSALAGAALVVDGLDRVKLSLAAGRLRLVAAASATSGD